MLRTQPGIDFHQSRLPAFGSGSRHSVRATMEECGPTLDVDMMPSHSEGEDTEETDSAEVWGRLFPVGKGFVAQGTPRARC